MRHSSETGVPDIAPTVPSTVSESAPFGVGTYHVPPTTVGDATDGTIGINDLDGS